jgi:hypothetical protein
MWISATEEKRCNVETRENYFDDISMKNTLSISFSVSNFFCQFVFRLFVHFFHIREKKIFIIPLQISSRFEQTIL